MNKNIYSNIIILIFVVFLVRVILSLDL